MADLKLPVGKNIVYKIRRRSDGLFSGGGSMPHFSKKGKIWKQRGHLTSHLNQLWHGGITNWNYTHPHQTHIYEDCEIVPYEIIEKPLDTTQTIMDYIEEREEEQRQKELEYQRRREETAKEARREEYERLKEEFE